eukprot:5083972-Pleurochrysis_carterae.AAC.5
MQTASQHWKRREPAKGTHLGHRVTPCGAVCALGHSTVGPLGFAAMLSGAARSHARTARSTVASLLSCPALYYFESAYDDTACRFLGT